MSLSWVNAAAFAGLALMALPIAIHLLVRQHTRVLAFPSLRFLSETALAAFRRRTVQDALLLVCRIAILAAAAAALAGPILMTAARERAHANRVSRAIIALDDATLTDDATAPFRAARFQRVELADAIDDARRWLDAQPPSAREMVFTGFFRRGSLDAHDLVGIPGEVGLRMVATAPPPSVLAFNAPVLRMRDGTVVRSEQRVRIDGDAVIVEESAVATPAPDRVRVVAAPSERALAEAALRAALEEGVPWTPEPRRLVIAWDGADAPATDPDEAVIRMAVPVPSSTAATAIWNAMVSAAPPAFVEPEVISPEQLRSWSRAPGRPSPTAVPVDEGDRRWLWAGVLALLLLEHGLRRQRVAPEQASVDVEANVA